LLQYHIVGYFHYVFDILIAYKLKPDQHTWSPYLLQQTDTHF
jgi:hypothetical protein